MKKDNANKSANETFMVKLSRMIVDKRNIVFIIYIAAIIFSFFSSKWVSVCNDLTAYLPANTETRRGLTVMNDEFTTYASTKAMVINITYPEAEEISGKLKDSEFVSIVDFDDTENHYKDGCALFDITLNCEEGTDDMKKGYAEIRETLADYDVYFKDSYVDDSESLASEMNIIIAVAALIILSVLLFTSRSYMEVPVMVITFIAATILNKGTNYWFGEISFVSNSVTGVLQLALSIDYAIIMIHHYSEERASYDQHDAVVHALAKSIVEISASSLTTVSGLLALMFMQFSIGFDLGLCLIKSIFFSLLCVFTLMPGLLMLLGGYIDKSQHKNFVPNVSFIGNIVYKLRFVVPPLFVGIIVAAFLFSAKCPYAYDVSSSTTDRKNETQIANEMIENTFGKTNLAALIVPSGDYDKEKQLEKVINNMPEVESVTSLASVEAKDGYVLCDKLTPRQFAELTGIDIDVSRLLYTVYAADNKEYSKLVGNLENFGVPLLDMFMFVYDLKQDGYVNLDDDLSDQLDDLYVKLDSAKKQLLSDNYSRILLKLNLPVEGSETFDFIDKVHNTAEKYYDEVYLVGNSTSSYDLRKSFKRDNIVIAILTILFVVIVLFFTFKSAGLPILLIAVIQGSVWMNFSIPYIMSKPIYFLSYLIVSSIQMGANIDYAIVISNRYMETKKTMPVKEAMRDTLNFAFPTILTSGTILASAGFLIGKLSTSPAIVSIGKSLCSGTLMSMFLVVMVLPEILLLGDTIIENTKVKLPAPEIVHKETGRFIVNGRVRGYINGFVDADIRGIVRGEMRANVSIDSISKGENGNEEDK